MCTKFEMKEVEKETKDNTNSSGLCFSGPMAQPTSPEENHYTTKMNRDVIFIHQLTLIKIKKVLPLASR